MNSPVPVYRGEEPYVFVSYAHDDAAHVMPLLQRLHAGGVRIWFDEGIDPGTRWRAELARAIQHAGAFLLFLSPRSAASSECWSEINFALDERLPFLALQLEEFELPPALRFAIADRQILKQSSDRSGAGVSRWLGEVLEPRLPAREPGPEAPEEPPSGSGRELLVGREQELARLRARREGWLDELALEIVVVSSEAGMGKSTLARAFLADSRPAALVLESACPPGGSDPFNALEGLARGLVDHMAERGVRGRRQLRDSSALARVFPVFRELGNDAGDEAAPPDGDLRSVRLQAFDALRTLLDRIAEQQPTIVWLDDFHRADTESRALLDHLWSGPDAPPILWLITQRAGAPAITAPHLALELDRLSRSEARALAHALNSDGAAVDEAALERCLEQALGSPLVLGLLLRAGAGADNATGSPWDGLSDPDREVLDVLAVAGHPVSRRLLVRTLGSDPDDSLARLEARALITRAAQGEDHVFGVSHVRIAELREEQLSLSARKALHLRIATAIEQEDPGDVFSLHAHYASAGRFRLAFDYLLRAAELATSQLAFARATSLYERALELRSDQSTAIYPLLALSLVNSGRTVAAAEKYVVAATLADSDDARYEQLGKAAILYLASGRLDQGIQLLRPALRRHGLTYPGTQRLAVRWQRRCLRHLRAVGLPEGETFGADPDAGLAAKVDLCDAVARGLFVVDIMRGVFFAIHSLLLATKLGDARRLLRAIDLNDSTGLLDRAGPQVRSRATQVLSVGRMRAKEAGDSEFLAWAFVDLAQKALQLGRWDQARVESDACLRYIRAAGRSMLWESNTATMTRLRALDELGDLVEMGRAAGAFADAAVARGDFYGNATGKLYGAYSALARDEASLARGLADEVDLMWAGADFHMQHFYIFRLLALCDLYEGDVRSAQERWQAFEPLIQRSGLLAVPMIEIDFRLLTARIRVAQALADDQTPTCSEEIAAIERHTRGDCQAHANLIRASVAALRGERLESAAFLTAAIEDFDRLGMNLWSAYAAARLGTVSSSDEARELQAQAQARMRLQGIERLDRWLGIQIPGFVAAEQASNTASSQPI
ncbi:MAG TPA: AAA family ATPase [Pseudomonadales bacterium]|nr:AAA family ATPase [Pseudomonadales bacterium]